MNITNLTEAPYIPFPDHTQLPDSDGTFVKNFQEHPQGLLLTDSLTPILQKIHPDGQYCIGQDSGIYWKMTDPPEQGAEAPDWFYVGNLLLTGYEQLKQSELLLEQEQERSEKLAARLRELGIDPNHLS